MVFNTDYKKPEWEQTIQVAREVIDSLEKQVDVFKKKADETTGKIMPVEDVGSLFGKRHSSISSYTGSGYYADNKPSVCAKRAREWADKTYAEAKEKHEKNISAIENNKALAERIQLFMQNVGIPSTYQTRDTRSRARYPKGITNTAGYMEDIGRNIKTDDGWSRVEQDYKRMISDIDKYIADNAKVEEEKKKAAEADAKAKEKELQRAALVLKYGLDYASGWDTILFTILDKNKYLYLAHYLQKNRCDWNDGYSYAETGLDGFTVESEQDKDIAQCIRGHIEDWCGDGRIFRDCEWNYDRIFGLVTDEDLMKDYRIANKATD